MQKLVPWLGGKKELAKKILTTIPEHQAYIEVFLGGGSLFFAKEPSKIEIINDLDARLITLLRVVQRHPEEFLDCLHRILYSRTNLNDFYEQPGLTDIEKASRFYFTLKAAFASRVNNKPAFTVSSNGRPSRISGRQVCDFIEQVSERLQGVYIEQMDFEKLIKLRDTKDAFFYLDPPYYSFEGCYKCTFDKADHQRLAKSLETVMGKWLLSYNDHEKIRELYQDYKIRQVPVNYSASTKSGKTKKANELLISNY